MDIEELPEDGVKKTEVEIPAGTTVEIDGDCHVVESGTMTLNQQWLYGAYDEKGDDPTLVQENLHFEVSLRDPDE